MKKLLALILICMLCLTTAYAAEWPEGRSAAQPYEHVPEIDLEESMGYIMLYPRVKMPAERFCDVLEIYLPREDLALGEGVLKLYEGDSEIADISFADADSVELRALEESEMENLMWGGGMCVEVHLPVSLTIGGDYHVLMDEGCFSGAEGKVLSPAITAKNADAWKPVLNGDFGVSGLHYFEAPEQPEDAEEAEEEKAAEEGEEAEPAELPDGDAKLTPVAGDMFRFDLVLGGDAVTAVVFSENDSVLVDTWEYTESTTVVGTVTKDELTWGVVFLDGQGNVIEDANGNRIGVVYLK